MINLNHEKFQEYKDKFDKIMRDLSGELDQVPLTYGFDGGTTAVHKKYAKKIKQLQKEYSFLFTEEHK